MKKKLDSRFPAARIKKIMQADEDVGKIAMAVPLLISKALELFLQDLCDRTYEITLQKGAKSLNSVHLKQCVQSFNVFDFLREIVGKVPNLGSTDVAGEDRSASKRRKVAFDDNRDSDDEAKKGRLLQHQQQSIHTNGSGRGGKRGRGRPRKADREAAFTSEWDLKFPQGYNDHNMPKSNVKDVDFKENHIANTIDPTRVRNFDLNLDLDENGDTPPVLANGSSANPTYELKFEEYPGWSVADVEKMAIYPIKLANLNSTVDEEYEDYDEEE